MNTRSKKREKRTPVHERWYILICCY